MYIMNGGNNPKLRSLILVLSQGITKHLFEEKKFKLLRYTNLTHKVSMGFQLVLTVRNYPKSKNEKKNKK